MAGEGKGGVRGSISGGSERERAVDGELSKEGCNGQNCIGCSGKSGFAVELLCTLNKSSVGSNLEGLGGDIAY